MSTKYMVGEQPTGWYFPGELTERPRLDDPVNENPIVDEDELTLAIEQGLAEAERLANGAVTPITAPIDTVDQP